MKDSFKFRWYQDESYDAGLEVLNKEVKRGSMEDGMIVNPTGAGKGFLVGRLTEDMVEPILVLQPSKELLKQNFEKFEMFGGKATICCASLKERSIGGVSYTTINGREVRCDEISHTTFGTIGSLTSRIEELKEWGVKKVVMDECFPAGTPIRTECGVMTIRQIHKKIQKGGKVKVNSYNEKEGIFELKEVIGSKSNGVKKVIKLNFTKLTFECTRNHKIRTLTGWKSAEDLQIGEAVLTSYEKDNVGSYARLNNDQVDLAVGSSLGDGFRETRLESNHIFRFGLRQGEEQEKYLKFKASVFKCEDKVKRMEVNGYAGKPCYHVISPTFYSEIDFSDSYKQIDKLNLKSLAILWMDDGHMSVKENSGSLYTLGIYKNKVEYLNRKLRSLGIRDTKVAKTKISSSGKDYWYIRFLRQSIEDISTLCSDYIHESMAYKVNKDNRKFCGTYKWDKETKEVVKILRKVGEVDKEKEVFDLEVEGNHNFTVTSKTAGSSFGKKKGVSGGGVVVHNCHLNSKPNTRLKPFLKKLGVTNILGLTATPFYLSGGLNGSRIEMINRTRGSIFKKINYVVQIKDIAKDYWSPLVYDLININQKYLQLNTSGTGYTEVSIRDYFENNDLYGRIQQEIDKARKEGRKKIVVFVPTIEEAEILHKKIKKSLIVHSKMPTPLRDAMVDDFSTGKGDVIINVSVLSVGYDNAEIDCIIDCAPTNSIASFYQKLGRGVRQGKKKNCKIVDLAGNVGRFGEIEELLIEDDENHGWGLFNGKGDILSHYSLEISPRPNRNQKFKKEKIYEEAGDAKFTFGKHEGKRIKEVIKEKNGIGYCLWLTKPDSTFQANGQRTKLFVENVRKALIQHQS